jgi:hypothetical protein
LYLVADLAVQLCRTLEIASLDFVANLSVKLYWTLDIAVLVVASVDLGEGAVAGWGEVWTKHLSRAPRGPDKGHLWGLGFPIGPSVQVLRGPDKGFPWGLRLLYCAA